MNRESYDRFSSREDVSDRNQTAFDDGFRARMDGQGLDTCPQGDRRFVDSWKAGWSDADQCEASEREQES